MFKDLVLLIIFNVTAHNNDRLPHEEHKKATDDRNDYENDTRIQYFILRMVIKILNDGPDYIIVIAI